MAESVDALVSNTSGATRAGSTPALGTEKVGKLPTFFLCYMSNLMSVEAPVRAMQTGTPLPPPP